MAYGIKVSRRGFDVNTCADNELLFSSQFPLLKLHSTGTYNVAADVGSITLTTHSLGYYPMYTIYIQKGDSKTSLDPNSGFYIAGDTAKLTLDTTMAFGSGITAIRWTIYYLDLYSPVDYGRINSTSTARGGYSDYGIRATKVGYPVNTTDKRGLAIDSSMRSLIIHQVANVEYVDPTLYPNIPSVTHNLGYPPFYLSYEKLASDNFVYQYQNVGGPFNGTSNTQIILFTTAGAFNATNSTVSFVVFKDPINLTV